MYRSVEIRLEDDSLVNAFSPAELGIHKGDLCVVECNRVPEYGQVVHLQDCEGDLPPRSAGPAVIRRATLQDQSRAHENAMIGRMNAKTVHKRVDEHKLPVHIVQVRYSFDRSVLHITYTSEDRVEYAEFVKALAGEFRVRIEMKSLGIRDAARLAGGMAVCGRPLCCREWLKDFEVVSVKMAKTQGLSLNPAAISGMCGRLKCCLKYEFETYRVLGADLPRNGTTVRCGEGCGCVWDKDVLGQRVKVRLEDGRVVACPANEVKPVSEPPNPGFRTVNS